MIYIELATIAFWLAFTGMVVLYFIHIFKARRAHKELYRQYVIDVDANQRLNLESPPEVKPPVSFFQSLVTSKAFWVITFWLITTSGFMMFIVEESCQVLGFGRYGLESSKLWPEAADACNYSAEFITSSAILIDTMAIFNPLAGYVFGRYMDAEEKKLLWEMQRIEKELEKLGQRIAIVEKQGNRIANELRIRPISPELITVSARGRPVGPEMPPKPKLSYPRAIDYETHAERVEDQSGMVYVTRTGTKYHKMFCRWLRTNMGKGPDRPDIRKITRSEATIDGLSPCGTCKPR